MNLKSFKEFLTEAEERRISTDHIEPSVIHKASQGHEESMEAISKGVFGRSFELTDKDTSDDLKPVDLSNIIKDGKVIDTFAKKFGYKFRFFTSNPDDIGTDCLNQNIEKKPFDIKRKGYSSGYIWVYNPCDSHGSFNDKATTKFWRSIHELAHALTEEIMTAKYGPSRRFGAMNFDIKNPYDKNDKHTYKGLNLLESQRSLEWEDVSFRMQGMLYKEIGLNIPKENQILDFNIAGHDVIIRLLTGDFSDPGSLGVIPNSNKRVSMKDLLVFLENQYKANAEYLGHTVDKGIDLKTWKPVSNGELKRAILEAERNPKKQSIVL